MLGTRYIMIGGFLGAGKTTAILKIAQHLHDRGQRVGLITNDQSTGLVDTAMLKTNGFATEEITGGCFCCKFNSLVEAVEKLEGDSQPDVFIAEPVGSCTDLKATVCYPLHQMHQARFSIAPLSVMVDPVRAMRVLGLDTGKNFSSKVLYIYEKQLEEADFIVINKCDLLDEPQLYMLQKTLEKRFGATVLRIAAQMDRGITEWIQQMEQHELGVEAAMDVDYDEYADGEALLGWLNGTYQLSSASDFDGDAFVEEVGRGIQTELETVGDIAHLKMTLVPDSGNDIAIGNLVRDEQPGLALSYRLAEPLQCGQLLLNLRAECDPEILKQVVEKVVEASAERRGVRLTTDRIEAFRPGRPTPTFRVS